MAKGHLPDPIDIMEVSGQMEPRFFEALVDSQLLDLDYKSVDPPGPENRIARTLENLREHCGGKDALQVLQMRHVIVEELAKNADAVRIRRWTPGQIYGV